jgi:hypothetical protein
MGATSTAARAFSNVRLLAEQDRKMARGLDTTKRLSLAGWRVLRFWTEVVPAAVFGSGHDVPTGLGVTAVRGGGG